MPDLDEKRGALFPCHGHRWLGLLCSKKGNGGSVEEVREGEGGILREEAEEVARREVEAVDQNPMAGTTLYLQELVLYLCLSLHPAAQDGM